MTQKQREERAVRFIIIGNIIATLAGLWAFVTTSSQALFLDAFYSGVALLSSIAAYLMARASKVQTRYYPDGLHFLELLQFTDDLVIAGVAVSLSADFTDFLHGVNDDQLGVRMLPDEELQLFIQTATDLVRRRGKMKMLTVLNAVHHKHPALDALVVVLQCKVENRPLMDFKVPQGSAGADVVGDLRHQKGFADLRRTGKDIYAPE